MSKVIILFERDIEDIRMIVKMFARMKIPRVYVRGKTDLWRMGMKPVNDQLAVDLDEIWKYDEECMKVISTGRGNRQEVKK